MRRRSFIKSFFFSFFATFPAFFKAGSTSALKSAAPISADRSVPQVKSLFGDRTLLDSTDIHIDLPEIAENGAVVPITISTNLERISKLFLWVEKNPTPLIAELEFDESAAIFVTARIKMAESGFVTVIAQQGEALLRRQKWVDVMQGGCGTG
ncbi:MAG: thiosulfate oxidation carrier protein SoxY [Gammaproteobacteria bacterium]